MAHGGFFPFLSAISLLSKQPKNLLEVAKHFQPHKYTADEEVSAFYYQSY